MSFIIIKPKDRKEWLMHRQSGIGSSEVGTILGLNPWDTPYQLWRRKMGMDAPKEENFAMKAGHYLEDAVSKFFEDATGTQIIKASEGDWLIVNREKEYLRVSPDRTFWLPGMAKNNKNKGILECKTTQMNVDQENIPMHWYCQLQYQLGVAELQYGALAWLTAGRSFDFREYEFDQEFYDYMIGEVDRFWVDNIQGKQEPLMYNVEDVLLRNPKHKALKYIEATEDMLEEILELKEIKAEVQKLDARKKELEERVKMAIGDAEGLVAPGGGSKQQVLATWKASKDSLKFDEKKFAAENPDLYAEYQYTKSGSRLFLLK